MNFIKLHGSYNWRTGLGRYRDIWEGVHAYVSRPVSEAFGIGKRGNPQSGEALQVRRALYRGVYE
jgi:hypothetical protein